MKKLRIAAAVIVLMAVLVSSFPASVFASSADAPAVSFAKESEKVYCGSVFNTSLKLSAAASNDITVSVTGSDNSSAQVTVPAGETSVEITLTAPAEAGASLTYTINEGTGYSLGKTSTLSARAYAIPKFTLYNTNIAYVASGKTLTNTLIAKTPSQVVREMKFTLRIGGLDGEVIGEITLPIWGEKKVIKIKADPAWDSKTDVYVCFDDANKVCAKIPLAIGQPEGDYGIREVKTEENKIAISFDCAYGEKFTYYILDLLDEYGIKATFFMTGGWISTHEDYVKEIYDRGHDIGNHTISHPRLTQLTDKEIYNQINILNERIKEITGESPTLFRPPYGDHGERVVSIAKYCGCETILWTYDPQDWRTDVGPEHIINRATKNAKAGDIVLFHNAAAYTKETLPVILDYYINELGLEVVKVSDLLYKGDSTVSSKGVHTYGSDYSNYAGDALFASYTVPADTFDGITAELSFDDTQWFLYKEDAAAIIADPNTVSIQITPDENISASVSKGDIIGTAVFSKQGMPDMTAQLIASEVVPSDTDADSSAVSGSDVEEGGSCLSPGLLTASVSSALLLIGLVLIFIISKKRRG